MIGSVGEAGGPLRLLVVLGDGRRLVTGVLSEQEQAELGSQVAGRLREPHPRRSMVCWLHPALPISVELEAGRVSRIALPAADG
ncbi:hypothetical protein ACFVXG_27850 [Kitasatospora sp. NPDC058162]|uniref:hypothetical protein n=1 Tax=Kitasatospora sp. NPDC058162 TaxID=3346362 RepID=UPI0036DE4F8E